MSYLAWEERRLRLLSFQTSGTDVARGTEGYSPRKPKAGHVYFGTLGSKGKLSRGVGASEGSRLKGYRCLV